MYEIDKHSKSLATTHISGAYFVYSNIVCVERPNHNQKILHK